MTIDLNTPSAIRPGQNTLRFGKKPEDQAVNKAVSTAVTPAVTFAAQPGSDLLKAYQGIRFAGSADDVPEVATPANTQQTEGSPSAATGPRVISADDILSNLSKVTQEQFEEAKPVMTFRELLDKVIEDPYRYLPTASSYSERALLSYGVKSEKVLGKDTEVYEFAKSPWKSGLVNGIKGVIGQEGVLFNIVKKLREFQEHGRPNRIILVLGPKGNGKSVIFDTIFEALEKYSGTPEGARYTFSWFFPQGSPLRAMPPLMSKAEATAYDQRAKRGGGHKPGAKGEVLPSNMNCHPLFLLPKEDRIKLIENLKAAGKLRDEDNFDYFIEGDLDVNSRSVFDALKKQYKGDLNKVYEHVVVESWQMEQQSGRGLAKIAPSRNRDAHLQQVSSDIDWGQLPRFVKQNGLTMIVGELPRANGGLFNMDDMGREVGDPGRYIYMLQTAETGKASITGNVPGSVEEQLDVILVASANPESLMKMAQEGQLGALRDRMDIVVSGHLREYEKEAQIYEPYIENAVKQGRTIGPHVLDTFALLMTMTRLFPINTGYEDYEEAIAQNPELKAALTKLGTDPLRKALLYQGEDINSYELGDKQKFTEKEKKLLQRNLGTISEEYLSGVGDSIFFAYEGGLGLSAREGQDLFQGVMSLHKKEALTILDIFEHLSKEFKAAKVEDQPKYFQRMLQITQEEAGDRLPSPGSSATPSYQPSRYGGREGSVGARPGASVFKTPRDLLKDVEGHARRQAQMEIKRALGLFRDPSEYYTMLDKYLAHVLAVTQQTSVKEQAFRSPSPASSKPDENLMGRIEQMITPETRGNQAVADFRQDLVGRFAQWDNSLSREENLQTIFAPEVQKMINHDEQAAKENLEQLVKDLISMWEDPGRFNQLGNEERKNQLTEALTALDAKGYPQGALPSILDWAFSDKFISDESYKVRRATKNEKH